MKTWITLAALALSALSSHADEHGPRTPPLAAYQSECGSCHVAFPARGLPASSWQHLMGGLGKHFGTDASLDAATTKAIGDWLQANAGRGDPPPEDRMTRARWFVREHDEAGPGVFQRPAIKSASNCAACHTRAAEGSFREREIRIPK